MTGQKFTIAHASVLYHTLYSDSSRGVLGLALDAAVLGILLQSCAPNVAPATLQAIIQVESQGNPYQIGVNRGGRLVAQPESKADAVATAEGLMQRGANFDAGLMQINSSNFAALGLNASTVFDPCTNLAAGARVLSANYRRAVTDGEAQPLRAALSEYNTGSRGTGELNGYVAKVFAAAGAASSPAPAYGQSSPAFRVAPSEEGVAALVASAFNARITDGWRPVDASYGAVNSWHKVGQAVDFVPRAGLLSISRGDIRALFASRGIAIIELLGPGDPGHDDHWHVAFASELPALPTAPNAAPETDAGVVLVSTEAPPPPQWDVFARAQWARSRNQVASQ